MTKISLQKVILVFFLIFYSLFAIFYSKNVLSNGDEVHYLLGAVSLIKDHDIYLENNYKDKDFSLFRPEKDLDHLTYTGLDNHEYPVHGIGYSFLIAPSYLLGGRLGVLVFCAVISSFLIRELFLFCTKTTNSKRISFFVSIACGLCLPFAHFSILVFTEIVGAFLILKMYEETFNKNFSYYFIPACTSVLVWINIRFFPLSLIFLVLWVFKTGFRLKQIFPLLLPLISIFGYFLFLKTTTGSFNPSYPFEQLNVPTTSGNIVLNILNHLVDRQYGLLVTAPIYFFCIPGFVYYIKDKPKNAIFTLILATIYLLPVLRYSDWQGGYTPPARYLVAILPLLIPSIVYLLKEKQSVLLNTVFATFSMWGVFAFLGSVALYPNNGFLYIDGISPFLWKVTQISNVNIHKIFPSFYPTQTPRPLHFLWFMCLFLLTVIVLKFKRRNLRV